MGIAMNFEIECERENDGRWLAEVPQLPGVLAYGDSANEAMAKAQILALQVLAERLENCETGHRGRSGIDACRRAKSLGCHDASNDQRRSCC
jgi:predicted RNase H-like HicB family nuclease